MKRFFLYALMLVLFTAPAFAAKNSQSVSISQAVTVGSTQLPAGEYKVSWTGTGTDVQVTISRSGIAPVTVPAKLVESKHSQNGYMVNRQGGVDQLETLQLNKVSLVLQKTTTASGQ
jgi:opacity protein-like surface antigen